VAGINRVALFTNEYPPHVYGGAGVHVEYLAASCRVLCLSRCAASASRTCKSRPCA